MWQTFRQVLHKLYVGRWLFCKAGRMRRNNVQVSEVKESARHAAVAYFKLHQLHLSGKFLWWFMPKPCSCWYLYSQCFTFPWLSDLILYKCCKKITRWHDSYSDRYNGKFNQTLLKNVAFLFIVGLIPGSYMWGLNLGLCAVNLAEASGEATSSTTLAEIYISAALRITVGKFKFLAVGISWIQTSPKLSNQKKSYLEPVWKEYLTCFGIGYDKAICNC